MREIEDLVSEDSHSQRETHNVTSEVFDQLAALAECRDFVSAGLIDRHGDVFEVGGPGGMLPVEVGHQRWSEHIACWPDEAPKRHGLVVDSRCNVFLGADVDAAHEFSHRIGDVYVTRELARTLREVDHPAIVAVKLRVQNVLTTVVDIREGNFPKAIAEESDFAGDAGRLILPSKHKMDVSHLTMMQAVRFLDRQIPEPSILKCKMMLRDDALFVTWDVDVECKNGLALSCFDEDSLLEDVGLRNLWIANIGRRLFAMKIGGKSDGFFHNLMIAAYSNGTVGPCRYTKDEIFYFGKTPSGRLELGLRIKLSNHNGPSGPGGGNRTDFEDGDLEFAMTG